ncbi:hypothetical protein [Porphyromonas pogonae]|uniref:hypothetical protein n=1 Tax=Porphyromonas pogonae TaxID=867595 RepID=UPI002E75C7D0|nr:hypothetical protein [Porphyromonas pogonae]
MTKRESRKQRSNLPAMQRSLYDKSADLSYKDNQLIVYGQQTLLHGQQTHHNGFGISDTCTICPKLRVNKYSI